MKKIITILAAISMLALSCQKEDAPVNKDSSNPAEGKLTATIVKTKVSYTETASMDLQPAWEVGDKIIGFDDAGNTYTLSVASVSAETATLNGTVPDGAMHLIYKSGAQASDISAKSLAVDYTAQKGNKTMPAVMLADGTVEDGACNFLFKNAGAIIGISAVNGVPSGSKISKITISGENLSAATVTLSGSALALNATEKADDAISVDGLNLTVCDASGTLSAPVFVAVPASAKIAKVSVNVPKEPETMKKPSATPQEGVDYVTIAGIKWAKWNVGAKTEKDYGWYFPWAGTEGYFRYADTWQSAKATYFEFSYSPLSVKTVSASDYVYVKTQTFVGHSFDWANAPFNNGSSSYNASYFSSVRNTVCPDDNLAPDYDAAHANWGGTWRMPTLGEFIALGSACGCVGQTTLPADLSSANPGQGVYWVSAEQTYIAEYTGAAGLLFCDGTNMLFFPASGSGISATYNGAGYYNRYWASTLRSSAPNDAYYFYYLKEYVNPQGFYDRYGGLPVRPVSD